MASLDTMIVYYKMLTVDCEQLARLNYAGFSERKIKFIKETFVRFQHFQASQKGSDWDWIRMDGRMFEQPDYEYWIYKANWGIKVLVEKKFGINLDLFGIIIRHTVNGQMEYIVYHTTQGSLGGDIDDNL